LRGRLGNDAPTVAILDTGSTSRSDVLRAALPSAWAVEDGSQLATADYLIVYDATVDADVLAAAQGLRRIIRIDDAGGVVDEEACAQRGIPVEVVESPTSMSVAEHVVMSMLILFKRVPQATAELRSGKVQDGIEPVVTTQQRYAYNWTGLDHWETLHGKPVGLVGLGKIGQRTARLLRCFGADVLYTKPYQLSSEQEDELGVRYETLENLLRSSRCVSLHNRLSADTQGMIGEPEFALMPRGSFFVNSARGALVDEHALVSALHDGHLAGAALDVFRIEPLPDDSPLLDAPNLLLTPHIAGIPKAESEVLELRAAARLLVADAA
jgi:D-3-phosphoglycerate dehydrogenase / 2-oxoglutarate reductase